MERGISKRIIDVWLRNEIIQEEKKELYIYGLQQGAVMMLNIFTTIVIGYLFGMVWESIVFMIAYIPLRSYAGGYHANTQIICYLTSILLIVIVLLGIQSSYWNHLAILLITAVSASIIYILAPVEDKNKTLDDIEIAVYKERTKIITAVEVTVLALFMILKLERVSICILAALIVLCIMLVIGKIKNLGLTR